MKKRMILKRDHPLFLYSEIVFCYPILEQGVDDVGNVLLVESENLFFAQGVFQAPYVGRRVEAVVLNDFSAAEFGMPFYHSP